MAMNIFSLKLALKKPKNGSKKKTKKQNASSYATACDTALIFDRAAELLFDFFLVVGV